MRKHMKYGVFVCVLSAAIVLVLLYYGMRNNTGELDSNIIPPDLSSIPSSPDNVLEAVQSDEVQVSVQKDPLEHPENRQVEQEPQIQSDVTAENSPKAQLPQSTIKGRKVLLEDGKEIIVIDNVPDSWKTETEVRFDKEGKAHVSHRK